MPRNSCGPVSRVSSRVAQVGQAEVHDLVDALAGSELVRDDVGRLQIAVDDAEVVRELERGAERRHDRLHLREAQPPLRRDFVLDRQPVQQLHHQERMVLVVHVEVEDGDDVRMAQARAGAALAKEPIARPGPPCSPRTILIATSSPSSVRRAR